MSMLWPTGHRSFERRILGLEKGTDVPHVLERFDTDVAYRVTQSTHRCPRTILYAPKSILSA
jgi:hypothetical protein